MKGFDWKRHQDTEGAKIKRKFSPQQKKCENNKNIQLFKISQHVAADVAAGAFFLAKTVKIVKKCEVSCENNEKPVK